MSTSKSDPIQMVPQVVVVGSGYWGQNLVRNFYQLNALCWRSATATEARLKELGAKYPEAALISDYQEVLMTRRCVRW
ncbi:MAG: hypothetical protein U0903_18335 [Planctomycetales bacterium]